MPTLRQIGLNHFLTPKLISGCYWAITALATLLVVVSSGSLLKKTILVLVSLIALRVVSESLIVFFKLYEAQQKTNTLLAAIHEKLSSTETQ
mgnify:CR=1 FL=1